VTGVLLDDLPHIDEHAVHVVAPPAAAWTALLAVLHGTTDTRARAVAVALGCDPSTTSGWERPHVGSMVPGFRIAAAEAPELLVVAGRHRFSRYGIVFRLEPEGTGSRLRAETRAAFPGPHGALYRLAVIGTGAHVVATRRMLRSVARVAEKRSSGTLS
jgi:hypothetical protein